MYALAASQVEYRFTQPIAGVTLLSLSADAAYYGAIVVSDAIGVVKVYSLCTCR